MIYKRITLKIKNSSSFRYVEIPSTGEVWIWHKYRLGWFRWRGDLYRLDPNHENFVMYDFGENDVDNVIWDDVSRQRELLETSGV